ncbi:hypothetical protein BJP23_14400 [Aeromonas veronii bv. veronii]|nr:hypothetical protein BJP23_14400 [Aeromonas veronii bv. veronii]
MKQDRQTHFAPLDRDDALIGKLNLPHTMPVYGRLGLTCGNEREEKQRASNEPMVSMKICMATARQLPLK